MFDIVPIIFYLLQLVSSRTVVDDCCVYLNDNTMQSFECSSQNYCLISEFHPLFLFGGISHHQDQCILRYYFENNNRARHRENSKQPRMSSDEKYAVSVWCWDGPKCMDKNLFCRESIRKGEGTAIAMNDKRFSGGDPQVTGKFLF